MCWTEITREQYRRAGLRYASDMTDAEWKLIEPLMPARSWLGRPRAISLRVIMNAILYVAASGCSMASTAERLSAVFDGSVLLLQVARFWLVAHDQ